ncbi:Tetratricopeptide repeat protein [Planctomycetes bacterium Pan216]|uniref:Tetratricopeptide repeat protein n=2 Tax=Kolteria novifilia TaxID=2527975 RepID=A0A518BB09_9BACT|nr:Tetratricopeptide repeat protein [Planctomycetes bacterium Pan216]
MPKFTIPVGALTTCCLLGLALTARAEIPTESYIEALKGNGFADLAIEYLQLEKSRPGLSKDEEMELDFEIASSMIAASDELTDLSKREGMLEEARTEFEKFTKKYPSAPPEYKGNALVEVATIDLQQGRLAIIRAQMPSNEKRAVKLAGTARDYLSKSAKDYESAEKLFKGEYDKMPVYIGRETHSDRMKRQTKTRLFEKYIEARFQAALARFYLADTYASVEMPAPDSKDKKVLEAHKKEVAKWAAEYKKLNAEAEKGFQEIFAAHRQEVVGLYAHLWIARCMADRGEYRRAMGIYEQLRDHENQSLAAFQRQVFYFYMLAFAGQKDWHQIVNQATEWLRTNVRYGREASYVGTQFELAKAYVELGQTAKETRDKNKYYLEADKLLDRLVRMPNQYQGLASRAKLRLQSLTGKTGGNENDFDALFAQANTKLDQVKDEASPEQRKAILSEVKTLLNRALAASNERTPIELINDCRLTLAYAHLRDEEVYEGAILAQALAENYPTWRGAPQAASLALTGFAWGYEDADKKRIAGFSSRPEVDADLVQKVANQILLRWPNRKEAADAMMTLGRLRYARQEYDQAAEAFDKVSPDAVNHGEALAMAGSVYWDWYKTLTLEGESADKDKKKELRDKARERLAAASAPLRELRGNQLDRQTYINDAMLGEVNFEAGDDEGALQAVMPLIALIKKDQLPADIEHQLRTGVMITALQSYIRQNKIDKTDELVELISNQEKKQGDGGGNVTLVFVRLASKLKEQIDRLRANGEQAELDKTVASFEKFLDKIAGRPDHDLQSLVYIGNSYVELGSYQKAAALLQKAIEKADPNDPEAPGFVTRARMLLARSEKEQGNYTQAIELINELMKENMNTLEIVNLRGEILESAGDHSRAIAHWKWLIKRMKSQRPKPDAYYHAMDRLLDIYLNMVPPADKDRRLKEGYKYVSFLLELDQDLPANWRSRFEKHRKNIAESLGIDLQASATK